MLLSPHGERGIINHYCFLLDRNHPRKTLGEILARSSLTVCPSLCDPLSVRAAADVGFEIGLIAGSVASMMVLGAPDITLTEFAEIAARACAAASIPFRQGHLISKR
jgi:2-methylisocitrate lyase-like PEP mutase family enzyme